MHIKSCDLFPYSKSLDKTYVFVYDNNGNIVKRREFAFTLKDNTLIEELESTDKVYIYNGDQMISYNGQASVYDVMGNPTTYRGKTATWVNGRRLASYDGHTFTYDGQGRRLTKDSVVFAYDSNGRLIKQGDNMEFFYDQTGVVGLKYGTATYLYRKDAQNNIIALIGENGAIVARYLYDAWGEVSVVDNNGSLISDVNHIGNLNPFRYRGYYYDTETKLYFLKTRYFDPEIGRFITIDDISYLDPETINGLNLYAYCNNNPVMNVDPNGNKWWHWLVGIAVIAVLAVATVATAGVAGVGIGTAFAAGFAGATIGTGVSGALVTVAAGAFAGAVISAGVGLVSGALFGGISSTMNGGSFWNGALEGASTGFMMGAITGAISGGIRSGITYARTTPLLRSVSANELESIKSMKAFSSNGSMESKWFATNKANVAEWAKYFGQSDYVGIRIPKNVLSNQGVYFNALLDGIGPAYCIDIDLLNTIIRGLWFF